MSTKIKHFSKKAALICLTPLLCNTIHAQEENNPQTELTPEQTKFNAANSAILDTVSNIVKQQVNLGTFIITGGNPDNNLTSIQEGINQIIEDLEGGTPSGFSTYEQVDNLGTSSDTSDIYSDFVHLGATSGDVSNLNTRLSTIDTNLGTKATSTQVSDVQTNIQGTAGTDGLTIGAIEGSGFTSSANSLVALKNAVTTLGTGALATTTQVNNLGTSSDSSGIRSDFVSLGSGEGDVSSLSTALALLATITQVNNLGTINDTSNVIATDVQQGTVTPFVINPTGNSTATNNKVNSQGAIIKMASNNGALTTTVAMTGAAGNQVIVISDYNTSLTTALTDIDSVVTDIQGGEASYEPIYNDTATALNSLIAAINNFAPMVYYDVVPTSGYSLTSINAALNELYLTLTYVLALTTPTP